MSTSGSLPLLGQREPCWLARSHTSVLGATPGWLQVAGLWSGSSWWATRHGLQHPSGLLFLFPSPYPQSLLCPSASNARFDGRRTWLRPLGASLMCSAGSPPPRLSTHVVLTRLFPGLGAPGCHNELQDSRFLLGPSQLHLASRSALSFCLPVCVPGLPGSPCAAH